VARVAAIVGDLMFSSKVQALLESGGHEVALVAPEVGIEGFDVLVVDLVSVPGDGVAVLERLRADGALAGVRTLATYSHVDADMRRRARAAGFDLVVPRSRMMREGADLVSGLLRA
jgi:CheY-like chemotaxis protein